MIDLQRLPISGGVVLAALLYAGVAWFVTGPIIGKRTVERSGWEQSCPSTLDAEIEARREPRRIIPRTDCMTLFGGWFREVDQLCREFGNPDIGGRTTELLREQEERRIEAQERWIAEAAARSGSRCSCAAATFVEEERVALAIHAGTARLVTPSAIERLHAGLTRSLHTPQCALDVVAPETAP